MAAFMSVTCFSLLFITVIIELLYAAGSFSPEPQLDRLRTAAVIMPVINCLIILIYFVDVFQYLMLIYTKIAFKTTEFHHGNQGFLQPFQAKGTLTDCESCDCHYVGQSGLRVDPPVSHNDQPIRLRCRYFSLEKNYADCRAQA